MNPLAKLIHTRKAELGDSWTELGKRGGFSSHSILYAIATKETHLSPPRQETLERIAKAIKVPLDVVKMAAAESAGFRFDELTTTLEDAMITRQLLAAFERVPPKDKQRVVRMVESMADDAHEA